MSYQVQITEAALPIDDDQASIEIDRLASQFLQAEEKPSSTLLKLHKQLVKKYPCLSSFRDDDPKMDDCVWEDGPLINNFGQQVAVLAIASDEEQVMAFILQCAGELNLAVADSESRTIYRPNSPRALAYIATQAKAAIDGADFNIKAVTEYVVSQLTPIYLAHGFVWKKTSKCFVRKTVDGDQRVWFFIDKRHGEFEIACQLRRDISRVIDLTRFIKENPKIIADFPLGADHFSPERRQYFARNFDELVVTVRELITLTSEKVIPYLQETISIQAFNAQVNSMLEKNAYDFHYREVETLLLGYIADRSNFDKLVEFYKEKVKNSPQRHIDLINKTVIYLEQNDFK
jgi:hypothetical protein